MLFCCHYVKMIWQVYCCQACSYAYGRLRVADPLLPHGVDHVAGVAALAARGAPTARGLGLAGYGIHRGLRRMSDLETPEADVTRDHSSVEAAPATFGRESQPGLDPNNPGAAPDIRRGHPRLAGLDRPVSDPVWDDAERVFAECCRLVRRLREQTARGLSLIATLYLRERHRWADFLAEHGVVVPRYGPRPSSQFHAVCRHFLLVGAGGDRTGYAGKLAAVLDEWHRADETISPGQLPAWIEVCGGIEHLYQASRFGATATSPSGSATVRRLPPMSLRTMISIENKLFGTAALAHHFRQHPSTPAIHN